LFENNDYTLYEFFCAVTKLTVDRALRFPQNLFYSLRREPEAEPMRPASEETPTVAASDQMTQRKLARQNTHQWREQALNQDWKEHAESAASQNKRFPPDTQRAQLKAKPATHQDQSYSQIIEDAPEHGQRNGDRNHSGRSHSDSSSEDEFPLASLSLLE
jgi:hypothetical protein